MATLGDVINIFKFIFEILSGIFGGLFQKNDENTEADSEDAATV